MQHKRRAWASGMRERVAPIIATHCAGAFRRAFGEDRAPAGPSHHLGFAE
jgi:hypothetical protein